jgi:hypothetical protein
MRRESSTVVERTEVGGRRAMRLLAVMIAIASTPYFVESTSAATMGAALDAGARVVSSNAIGAFARAVEFAKTMTTRRARCGLNGVFCEEDLCRRARRSTAEELMGQPTGVELVLDALCDHVETPSERLRKPLVMSMHGSPGTGKSTFHRILARAAYNATTSSRGEDAGRYACPGRGCPGYKVIFGTDYVVREREAQARMLRDAVTRHLERFPESVVVVEEYDKLGCPARGMLKQMLEHGSAGGEGNPFDRNVTFSRSIFVLEANMGFMDVHDVSAATGRRVDGDALVALQRKLKDGLFEKWTNDGCEDREDTLKVVGAIDMFVPFVPLDRAAVKSIVHAQLVERGRIKKHRRELGRLEWDDDVLERLVDEVEFEGKYAIEGGKEVSIVLSRCVTRALRLLAESEIARAGTDGVGASHHVLRDRIVRLKPSSSASNGPVVAVLV